VRVMAPGSSLQRTVRARDRTLLRMACGVSRTTCVLLRMACAVSRTTCVLFYRLAADTNKIKVAFMRPLHGNL